MTHKKTRNMKDKEVDSLLQEFCDHTAIPWLKYFLDPRLSRKERIVIAVILLTLLVHTVIVLFAAWRYKDHNITITNIETLQTPSWEQTYPSFYICPLNRISRNAIEREVDKWILPHNMTKEVLLQELRVLPPVAFKQINIGNLDLIGHVFALNNISLKYFMNKISLSCEDILDFCQWKSDFLDCGEAFKKIITPDGYCCAFQQIPKPKRNNIVHETMAAYNLGLSVMIFLNKSDTFSSLSASTGYFVYAATPNIFVDCRSLGRLLGENSINFYTFTSTRIEKIENIINSPVEISRCRVDGKLAGFKYYSLGNCLTECIVNVTLQLCRCVPIIYQKYSDDLRYCDLADSKCLGSNRNIFKFIYAGINISEYTDFYQHLTHIRPCGCLSSCYPQDSFDITASSSRVVNLSTFEKIDSLSAKNEYMNHIYKKNRSKDLTFYSSLQVFSQANLLTKVKTDFTIEYTQFMGTCGSIVSFTMGWSLICGVELFYFIIHFMIQYLIKRIKFTKSGRNIVSKRSTLRF